MMEQNNIHIKCPHCGAVLSVKDEPGLNEKSTTCPVCKQKSRIKDFERIAVGQQERTELPTEVPGMKKGNEDPRTSVNMGSFTLGKLFIQPNGPTYQLHTGRNIIGRKHDMGEHADFEIQTNSKRMSRLHLVIEVKKIPDKGFVNYVSLYGQKANATFVGNNRLEVGDCLVLNVGDIIQLPDQPDIKVRFEIPDGEETILDIK